MLLYILDENGRPKRCKDLLQWAWWFADTEKRVVDKTDIEGVRVSTVFLGIDHSFNFLPGAPQVPVLWETMTFPDCSMQRRYTSLADAKKGHHEVVSQVREALGITVNEENRLP